MYSLHISRAGGWLCSVSTTSSSSLLPFLYFLSTSSFTTVCFLSVCKFYNKGQYICLVIIMPHARRKRNWNKKYYGKNRDEILAQKKEAYSKDPEDKKVASKEAYNKNPKPKKVASKKSYDQNPGPKKIAAKVASKKSYDQNPGPKKIAAKVASKKSYDQNPGPKKIAAKVASKKLAKAMCFFYHCHSIKLVIRSPILKGLPSLYHLVLHHRNYTY